MFTAKHKALAVLSMLSLPHAEAWQLSALLTAGLQRDRLAAARTESSR